MKVNLKHKAGLIAGNLWLLKSVVNNNGSMTVSLPKAWVQVFCKADAKGRYQVGYRQAGDEIVIKAYRGEHDSH